MELDTQDRSTRVRAAMRFAVAALACEILLVVSPFDVAVSPLSFGLADGLSGIGKIANLVTVFATTVTLAIGIAFLGRGASSIAAGVFVAAAIFVAAREIEQVLHLLDGRAWVGVTLLRLAIRGAECVLLFFAARAARREEPITAS